MPTSRSWSLGILLAGLAALTACGGPTPLPSLPPVEARTESWQTWRAEKDSLFQTDASPLLPDARARFDGLAYFAYDSTFAFALSLEPALQRDTLRLATSTGEPRDYVRFGHLSFPLDGLRQRLTVFQPVDGDLRLFLPFADATNGRSTYAAGRYLDFEPSADGRYVLDFNYAYSPYCAYNADYSCPLPPAENRLAIPVRAGEQAQP